MSVRLTTDLDEHDAVPYFLWDDPMTVRELHAALGQLSAPERYRLLGKILREACDPDVWRFTSPQSVQDEWSQLAAHLGRRRRFWEDLLAAWREDELIHE